MLLSKKRKQSNAMSVGEEEMINIRKATADDLIWVNRQYETINFVPSGLEHEVVLIGSVGGEKAGLGRLVLLGEGEAELGGIYTLEGFRGTGVASCVVQELMRNAHALDLRTIYCIPFAPLHGFYSRYGFQLVTGRDRVNPAVLGKYQWCMETYSEKTLLMLCQNESLLSRENSTDNL